MHGLNFSFNTWHRYHSFFILSIKVQNLLLSEAGNNNAGPNPDIHTHRLTDFGSAGALTVKPSTAWKSHLADFLTLFTLAESLRYYRLLSGITDSLKRCDGEFGATRGSLRTNRKEQLHEKEYVKVYTENGQMKRIVLISLYKLMFCSKPLVLLTLLELEGKFGWCDLHDAKQVYLPSTLSGKRRGKPFM